MSFYVQRSGRAGKRVAELMERYEANKGTDETVIASGVGTDDLDAAISLDIVAQGIRAATQLNFVRAKAEAQEVAEEAEAQEIIFEAPAKDNN